jgi:hypothetical protein
MEIVKKYIWLPVIILVLLAGVFSFFFCLYQNDMKKLEDFVVAYENFDKAVSDYSKNMTKGSEGKASETLVKLKTHATFRLSSMIKHEKEIMKQTPRVARLATEEFASLQAYQKAIKKKDPGSARLAKENRVLSGKRKAAYARFQALGQQ